jgi:hypothetical protein
MDDLNIISQYVSGEVVAGAILGAVISLALSWWDRRQLKTQTEKLREYNMIMLRLLDDVGKQTGLVEVNWDSETGEPIGIKLKRTATSSVGIVDSVSHQLQDSHSSSTEESNDK